MIWEAHDDFIRLLDELGLDAATLRRESEDPSTYAFLPLRGLKVDYSPIEGRGVFATHAFLRSETLGPAAQDGVRTDLGRYTNHHPSPNAEPFFNDHGDLYLRAKRPIEVGEEVTVNYRHMPAGKARLGLKVHRMGEDGEVVKSLRDQIMAAEQVMALMPQVEIEPTHRFADGVYAREILIPAGTLLTGKVHRNNDLNIVLYGHMSVLTEDGMKEVRGPLTFTACAGVKQMGYAYEDTLWVTIHATPERDLDILEKTLFVECDGEPHVLDFKTGKALQEVLR